MTQITEKIWIGNSMDEFLADVDAILNVAQDLQCTRGWRGGVEYMQTGLIDGPGNLLSAYYAAVLALSSLVSRHKRVLVCCHTGSRAIAVVMMHANVDSRRGWEACLEVISERVDERLPTPNPVHRTAFERLNWTLLTEVTR